MKNINKWFHLPVLLTLLLWVCPLHGVVVSTASALENAVSNANSGGDTTIILTDGTYYLSDALGVWADGLTVRSQSGNRENVFVYGQGMTGGVSHIFNVAGTNFTAKDMTIGRVSAHAIQIWGNNNSSNTLLSNLHIVDTYEQMVKISYDSSSSNSSRDGVMENCLLEYTAGIGPQYYIGGIDGHQCVDWTVRGNTFKNIRSPSGDIAEHAVHFWSDSQGTLVENNIIINCDRGIGFGLGDRGHSGGIIRNNFIYHNSTDIGFSDVGIGLENASGAQVYNNTVYFANSYPNAIEYRFSGTSGGIIRNNLCNKSITARNGGSATTGNNITNASSSWFVNVSSGDLHLASAVSQVVDQGVSISGLTADIDGDSRPQGSGIDIGADEWMESTPPSAPPFGSFDSPLEGTTVRSSIPVTGWALDDVEVGQVIIYRDPVAGENSGWKEIGIAVFVEGARTDIETQFPGYPNNHKAGWGYMMLTNFLPNQGNGTFTLHAVAVDTSGNSVILGSKTITCDNINAVKPFGAIETPVQGGTASGGSYRNWGWVLTPPPCIVPTDGSTIEVQVNGVTIGNPVYDLYRSDVAALFPGYANSDGAFGYFDIDTTAYADGVHVLQWLATDDHGHKDGIGSRYFKIENTGNRGKAGNRHEAIGNSTGAPVWAPKHAPPPTTKTKIIEIHELQPIKFHLKPGTEGYMVINGRLRPLPTGSTLDREKGIFYWSPGVGFLGEYRFIFNIDGKEETMQTQRVTINLIVKIIPKGTTRRTESEWCM